MSVLIYNDKNALFNDLAEYVLKIGNQAIAEHGHFNFVLTGGSSPKALYEALATTHRDQLDWNQVYFFFGDERDVSPENESYNGLMAKKAILDPLEIAADHILYVNTRLNPQEAAQDYIKAITAHFKGESPAFDLILLGMGDEAHTASMFPDTDILTNDAATVAAVYVEKLSANRISFTAPLINLANNVAFLVFGSGKADAVKQVIEPEEKNPMLYPAQLIQPIDGSLTWFLDEDAAALLTK
jgi:6-phosphogluconolactonase